MAFSSYYIKVGRLRLYSKTGDAGVGLAYFFEVPFRGPITAPVDRPRPPETLVLDRGRADFNMHYVSPPDDPIVAPIPFGCQFRLGNTEPNYTKLLTIIRSPGGALTKSIGGRPWSSSKGTTQLLNNDPLGQVLFTTPPFSDPEKFCVNIEILWEDPQSVGDRGFRYNEVYFPPDRQMTEGVDSVMVDLTGEIYGSITLITAFTAGTES
jgi:hypothetical protein